MAGGKPAAGDLVGAAESLFYRGERLRADRLLGTASFKTPAERATVVLARARLLATGGDAAGGRRSPRRRGRTRRGPPPS